MFETLMNEIENILISEKYINIQVEAYQDLYIKANLLYMNMVCLSEGT